MPPGRRLLRFVVAALSIAGADTASARAYAPRLDGAAIPSSPSADVVTPAQPLGELRFTLDPRIGFFAAGDPVNGLDPDGRFGRALDRATLGPEFREFQQTTRTWVNENIPGAETVGTFLEMAANTPGAGVPIGSVLGVPGLIGPVRNAAAEARPLLYGPDGSVIATTEAPRPSSAGLLYGPRGEALVARAGVAIERLSARLFASEVAAKTTGPNIALGSRYGGLRTFASDIGAEHLLEVPEAQWKAVFQSHVKNPSATFNVSMKGFFGDSPAEMILNEIGSGSNTGWELQQLQKAGRLSTVNFYDEAGKLIPNPFK